MVVKERKNSLGASWTWVFEDSEEEEEYFADSLEFQTLRVIIMFEDSRE